MEPLHSLILSLRGFSSVVFGKTNDDWYISKRIRKFIVSRDPTFYVRPILPFRTSSSERKVLKWFAVFCSHIHLCRLWHENARGDFDSPLKVELQSLLISLDQELAVLEGAIHSTRSENTPVPTLLKLYGKFRVFFPLFVSLVNMIGTFNSDSRCRRRGSQKRNNDRHPYIGSMGVLSELEISQEKAYFSFDMDLDMLNHSSSSVRYRHLSTENPHSSLNLSLRSHQCSLFSFFCRNMYNSWLKLVVSNLVQYVEQNPTNHGVSDSLFSLDYYAPPCPSKWTPRNNSMLWAMCVLLEYCKVDFDVLGRFKGLREVNDEDLSDDALLDTLTRPVMKKIFDRTLIQGSADTGSGSLMSYLLTGVVSTINLNSREESVGNLYVDRHQLLMEKEQQNLTQRSFIHKANQLLQFVIAQSMSHKVTHHLGSAGDNPQIWMQSLEKFPVAVFDKLAVMFEQVNKCMDSLEASNESKIVTLPKIAVSFVHHKESIRRHVFSPLCQHLIEIKSRAYKIIEVTFQLRRQLEFIGRVFLLGRIDCLQPFKELILLLPVFLTKSSSSSSNSDRSIFASESQSLWQSLSFSLETAFMEQKPKIGVQYFSVFVPTLFEARKRRNMHKNVLNSSTSSSHRSDTVYDESLLHDLVQQMRLEIHYQWPLAMLFPSSYIQRFQRIYQFLLTLMTLKWLSEGWWKAIIPKGGLKSSHSLRKPEPKSKNRNQQRVLEVQGNEEEVESLQRAQRHCQQSIIQLMNLMQLLSGYYLSRIHERLWPNLIEQCTVQQSATSLHGEDSGFRTIEGVQIAIRDCVEFIEDLIGIIEQPMEKLLDCALRAFQELRSTISADFSYNSSQLKKDVLPSVDDYTSKMEVAYRMTEISFEDVNDARESLMIAILAWNSNTTPLAKDKAAISESEKKRKRKGLSAIPQSAWKMNEMQREKMQSYRRLTKTDRRRLFSDDDAFPDRMDRKNIDTLDISDIDDDEVDIKDLQPAYSIEFLRCVEELQTQCGMLWTEE